MDYQSFKAWILDTYRDKIDRYGAVPVRPLTGNLLEDCLWTGPDDKPQAPELTACKVTNPYLEQAKRLRGLV